eukprot:jgi/Ulvmu1/12094/UM084_0019.1
MWLTQSAAPLVCSMLRGTEPDLDIEQSPKTSERTKLLGSSSPRPSLILDRPGMHIKIPSSNFAAYSAHGHALAPPAHTPFAISNLDIESQDSSSPLSPPLSCGPATPSLPSRSPTGCDRPPTRNGQSPSTAPHGHSSIFPELREAARYLLHTLTSPARRAALYGSCAMALHLLSMICVIWFAVSWLRTYSFSVARTDLITVLRYMLLVAAPFALWCLPALCALSALLSWPHAADPDADGAHLHSSANSSPISFPVPRRSGCFDADPAADTYAVAAASQDLLHEAATPRFGFTIFTDPQAVTDGGAASPHTPPRRPSPRPRRSPRPPLRRRALKPSPRPAPAGPPPTSAGRSCRPPTSPAPAPPPASPAALAAAAPAPSPSSPCGSATSSTSPCCARWPATARSQWRCLTATSSPGSLMP